MSVLAKILAQKQAEVAELKARRVSFDGGVDARRPLDAIAALTRPPNTPLRLIAEVKFASPSAGPLSRALDAEERARVYELAGAAMVSVLCDATFFAGGFGDLSRARRGLDQSGRAVPILAKEFVIDEVQIDAARAYGADCLLLIARIVSEQRLRALVSATRACGMEPLVEVANELELDAALTTEARLIGVNARDLDSLVIATARASAIVAAVPSDRVAVHLSGLKSAADIGDVAGGRAHAALVGEALMRQDDPRALLEAFVAAAGGRPAV